MALSQYPKTITDGLIFALDAGDVNSYPGSGLTVNDLTGNHPGGDLYGGTQHKHNNYFRFDGVNDGLSFTTHDTFEFGTSAFTMEAWVRLNDNTGTDNFSMVMGGGNPLCDGCEGGYMILFSGNNNLNVRFDNVGLGNMDSVTYNSPTSLVDGQFHHIVGLRDGSNVILYLDGIEVARGTDRRTDVNDIGTFFISGWSNYRGNMDVGISKLYNRALSEEEVLNNYKQFKLRYKITELVEEGLVIHMDPSSPSSYPGSGNSWFNIIDGSQIGTLLGNTSYSPINRGCFKIDHYSDYIIIEGVPTTEDWTLNMWVLIDKTDDFIVTGHRTYASTDNLRFQWDDKSDTIAFAPFVDFVSPGGSVTGFTNKTEDDMFGNWHMVTMTCNSTTNEVSLYFDAKMGHSSTPVITSPRVLSTDGLMSLGANLYSGIGGFDQINRDNGDCYIGPLTIYERALSPNEVAQNFNAHKLRFNLL